MSDSESDTEQLSGQQLDEEWDDWADGDADDEGEDDTTKSLFDDTLLPNPEAAFQHDAAHHSFDLRQFRIERCLDDYETIKVINFIRTEVAAGRNPMPALTAAHTPAATAAAAATGGSSEEVPTWSSDAYLVPVLADDPLITYDYDDVDEEGAAYKLDAVGVTGATRGPREAASRLAAAAGAATGPSSSSSMSPDALTVSHLARQVAALSADNRELQLRCAALMEAALPQELRQELREAAAEDSSSRGAASSSTSSMAAAAAAGSSGGASSSRAAALTKEEVDPSSSSSSSSRGGFSPSVVPLKRLIGGAGGAGSSLARRVDAAYFDSYSYFDIHHDMLSDKPRTCAYQSALTLNPSLVQDAVVLDVGCGTSILSLFAAKGGAKAVVGLDGSERIAGFARKVVAANRLDAASGGPISIITGKVEEVSDIGHDKVSVIVSEWMGYALLFESMLDSLLAARDKWLAPGGALLPDIATIWVAGADSGAFGSTFWKDVYGFNMSPIGDELSSAAASESQVLVRPVEASCLNTHPVQVHHMDLATMTHDQQDFTTTFTLTAAAAAAGTNTSSSASTSTSSDSGSVTVSALVLWFDVEFSKRFCRDHPVTLSTSPTADLTHWAHAVLPLQRPVQLSVVDDGGASSSSSLSCRLSMARSRSRHRSLDISLEVSSAGGQRQARVYTIEVTGTD